MHLCSFGRRAVPLVVVVWLAIALGGTAATLLKLDA